MLFVFEFHFFKIFESFCMCPRKVFSCLVRFHVWSDYFQSMESVWIFPRWKVILHCSGCCQMLHIRAASKLQARRNDLFLNHESETPAVLKTQIFQHRCKIWWKMSKDNVIKLVYRAGLFSPSAGCHHTIWALHGWATPFPGPSGVDRDTGDHPGLTVWHSIMIDLQDFCRMGG
jgi:hypothetical protein